MVWRHPLAIPLLVTGAENSPRTSQTPGSRAAAARFVSFWLLGIAAWTTAIAGRSLQGGEKSDPSPAPANTPAAGSMAMRETVTAATAADVHFGREIQPIFAKRCLACHGPDQAKGGLRLDRSERALAELESGDRAIVPRQPDASALLERVASTDKSLRMPPEGAPLSPREIDLLRRWISQGAKWEQHWAFSPIARPAVPPVRQADWVRNPVDAFILHRLERAGLTPASPVEKLALLRRVTYSLTGLPPTPEEARAFQSDTAPDAYEKVVDRLLASPRYGEHWARHWLDVVRYADTNSYERDGPKPHSWRYRDYVIRALNDDKPYDQFIREQLAGDELPEPTAETITATGFYRLGIWDDEPTDVLQARYDVLDDILTTTGQAFLGLTINCGRCHDHKIDPISQKEYYSLLAFIENVSNMARFGPNIEVPIFPTPASRAKYLRAKAELDDKRQTVLEKIVAIEDDLLQKWGAKQKRPVPETPAQPDLTHLEFQNFLTRWTRLPYFKALHPAMTGELPHGLVDIRFTLSSYDFGLAFTGTLHVPADGDYTFTLDSDDGSRLTLGDRVLIDSPLVRRIGNPEQATITLKKGPLPFRLEYFQFAEAAGLVLKWSGPGFQDRWLSSPGSREVRNSTLLAKVGDRLLGPETVKHYNALREELEKMKLINASGDYALAVTEARQAPPESFVRVRGNSHTLGEKVIPRFPHLFASATPQLPPYDPNLPTCRRRLALAHWIASPDNRLTGRVLMNRLWQHHFGRGIVRSPNNFGLLGDAPTHPELLDWLATELVRHGWKLKPLHKLLVMSATFRQSAHPSPLALQRDPLNDLFSRFEMRRLKAEEIRDSVLAVNGRLNLAMYGPGVFPKISQEVLAGQSRPGEGWGKSTPAEQARRSVYIHVKRSLITTILSEFDFPDTDSTCAARFSTTQPTQSLGMLNGEFMHTEARELAQRLPRDAGPDRTAQVRHALELVLAHPPAPAEVQRGVDFIQKLMTQHRLTPDEARMYYCLLLYNQNEFLYVD